MTPIVTPGRAVLLALVTLTFSDIAPELSKFTGLALVALSACYLLTCLAFPFRKCRACKGMGRFMSGLFGGIRLCGRCDGTGLRLRAGRRVINHLRRNRRTNRH